MASGIELATAYVSITAETSRAAKDINRLFAEADKASGRSAQAIAKNLDSGLSGTKNSAARAGADAAQAYERALQSSIRGQQIGEAIGRPIGKGIGLGIKAGIGVAAAGATAAVGALSYALTSGFNRLKSIDSAKFKLQALGNSTEDVAKIMESATTSVKGTAFSLDQAANAAASSVAAGIKPGKELTKYLSTTADAAAVAGTNFDDMASIFNKVQTNGKAFTDDLQQLADRGLPIFTWLQEQYGVSGEALSKMVQDGKVDAADFQTAIETHIGGAAQKMGESLDGSISNMKASIARLGANFLAPILGMDPAKSGSDAAAAVQHITDKLNEMGAWVLAHQGDIKQYWDVGFGLAKDVVVTLGNIAGALREHPDLIRAVGEVFIGWKALSAVSNLLGALGGVSKSLRTDMPAAAAEGAAGVNKYLALIVVPEIGKQLNDQIQQFLKDNFPTLYKLNNTGTPDQWADALKNGTSTDPNRAPGQGTLQGGIPQAQLQAPAGTRESGGVPTTIDGLPATQAQAPAGTRESGGLPPGVYVPYDPAKVPHHALGGPIGGMGPKGKDSTLIMAAPGEHMLTADEVDMLGGQGGAYALRAAIRAGAIPGFSGGGAIWKTGHVAGPKRPGYPYDEDTRPPGTHFEDPNGTNPDEPYFSGPNPGLRPRLNKPGPVGPDYDPGWHLPWWGRGGTNMDPSEARKRKETRVGSKPGDFGDLPVTAPNPAPSRDQGGRDVMPPGTPWDPKDDWQQVARRLGIPGFENGGAIPAIDYAYGASGQPYNYGAFDCSMFMSQIYARMAGLPPGRYFTTDSDFAALGFKKGYKPGALNIGTNGGVGENGHMAGTLPNGINVENAGSAGSMYGAGAKGANDFSQQWYYEPPNSGDMGAMQQHGMSAGLPPGPVGADGQPVTPGSGATPTDSGRTEGYIPAGAGNNSVAGTSFVSGLYNMGAEAINGLIDQAASAAATAASAAATAGTFGAGGQAAGPAAAFAIGMGANAAKRGVSYGFQMLGIGTDALIEQLTPFGAPRWLSTDPTAFMPQGLTQAATTTAEQQQPGAQPAQAGMQPPAAPPMPPEGQHPGTGALPGPPPPGMAAPAAGQPQAPQQNDWWSKLFSFDQGGVLEPGMVGKNFSSRPEYVFTEDQMAELTPATGNGIHIGSINGIDPDKVGDELLKVQRRNALQYQGRP